MTAKCLKIRGYAFNFIALFSKFKIGLPPNQSEIICQAVHMVLLMNSVIYDIMMRPIFPDINPY